MLPLDVVAPVTGSTPASEARAAPELALDLPWLQPYPDARLPDAQLGARESVALAFLAALQLLPPRQRAALLLAEVLDGSAAEVAAALDTTVASVNSALQRARATLRERAAAWQAPAPVADEQDVLRRFVAAWEQGDVDGLVALLRDDARWSMPPARLWFEGRAAIEQLLRRYPPTWEGRSFRCVPVGANRQPAAAMYLRAADDDVWRFVGVHALGVRDGRLSEIVAFGASLCAGFRLPATIDR
ncbi:MAG: RNA polymerase subunit sigma-70 [Myxococcota bacterium]